MRRIALAGGVGLTLLITTLGCSGALKEAQNEALSKQFGEMHKQLDPVKKNKQKDKTKSLLSRGEKDAAKGKVSIKEMASFQALFIGAVKDNEINVIEYQGLEELYDRISKK